jgi:hypothetical protein
MFCPECKAEYVKNITMCPDCQATLVDVLSDHTKDPPIEYEDILATYNQGDLALLKSVLEDAEIDYHIKTEFFNQIDPLIQPAVLEVRKDQAAAVRKMLKDMKFTFLGVSNRTE